MAYRTTTTRPRGTGALVTFRHYADPIQAQIARARLDAEGIAARVLDEGLHNVIMPGSVNGIRLQVPEADLARVEEILREQPGEGARDDGEGAGVVRCPRCELAYCYHERMRVEGSSGATALTFVAAIFMWLVPKRWHCHKCGHVWDDSKEGPAEMTKLGPDDPRPVFRLRRAHAGMGLFIGVPVGFVLALAAGAVLPKDLAGLAGVIAFVGSPVVGWLVGRALRYDVCSEPSCRAVLAPDREECARCDGDIAGVIHTADEHYAAAADFRRELARERARDVRRKKKKNAKKPAALRDA